MTEGVGAFLRQVEDTPWLAASIAGRRFFPARSPRFAAPAEPWSGPVRRALELLGVAELYVHQAQAVDLIRAGRHVVVATPTASGKSLVYNLPVLEACQSDRRTRACR